MPKGIPNNKREAQEIVWPAKIDFGPLEHYLTLRERMYRLWELVSKPVKFPDRRRREDRKMPPKAA